MKGSLIVLAFFCAGLAAGRLELLPAGLVQSNASLWTLYLLLVAAGMGMGFDLRVWRIVRDLKFRIVLVPLMIIAGTLAGGVLAHFLVDLSLRDALAVSAGFGYYSLSSVIITQHGEPMLGAIALLANMTREIITLVLTPLCQIIGGRLGPLAAGGAASMDTCLPVIAQTSGERYAIVAVFSGVVLEVTVPILIPVLFWLFG